MSASIYYVKQYNFSDTKKTECATPKCATLSGGIDYQALRALSLAQNVAKEDSRSGNFEVETHDFASLL